MSCSDTCCGDTYTSSEKVNEMRRMVEGLKTILTPSERGLLSEAVDAYERRELEYSHKSGVSDGKGWARGYHGNS